MAIRPKVSIVSISYNQERYIAQALDSFLEQSTNFDFEVIVADDCSTDNTPAIISQYAKKFPNIIKPVLRRNNIGIQPNMIDALRRAKGDYIALCEGDDYWTDPLKLQIQADFLDDNAEFGLVFHPVRVFFENQKSDEYVFPKEKKASEFNLENLLKGNFIQTNSVMYRRQDYTNLNPNVMPFDWYVHLFHAKFTKIGFIDKVMSSYRRQEDGVWWNMLANPDLAWTRHGMQHLVLFEELLGLFGKTETYREIIDNHIYHLINTLIDTDSRGDGKLVRQAIELSPKIVEVFILEQHSRMASAQSELGKKDEELVGKTKSEAILRSEIGKRDREIEDIHSSKLWKLIVLYRNVKDGVGKSHPS